MSDTPTNGATPHPHSTPLDTTSPLPVASPLHHSPLRHFPSDATLPQMSQSVPAALPGLFRLSSSESDIAVQSDIVLPMDTDSAADEISLVGGSPSAGSAVMMPNGGKLTTNGHVIKEGGLEGWDGEESASLASLVMGQVEDLGWGPGVGAPTGNGSGLGSDGGSSEVAVEIEGGDPMQTPPRGENGTARPDSAN